MRLYVHRSPAQQQIKRKQAGKQTPAAPPCHNHQDGGHADMRTGECRRRTLAHLLRAFHQIIKESVFISRTGQQLLVVVEVIADSREYPLRHVIPADSRKIELRPCHRHEDIYQVVDEESGDYHERHFLKKVEAVEEIPHHYQKYHRIVEEITHIERFAHPHLRKTQTEPYGRLSAEYPLLDRSENMVQVGEDTVELECVGIPVGEQRHLDNDADESRKLAGRKPVKIHQQKRHACNHSAVCKHLHRMIHFLEKKQYEYGSQQIIYQRNLLYRKKPFTGFYSLE